MVRKKSALSHLRLSVARPRKLEPESLRLNGVAEAWLARIRARLPEDGTAVVTVHRLPELDFLVSFRAAAHGETFISEAREKNLDLALQVAGARLLERLSQAPSQPVSRWSLAERLRELFS